MPSEKRSTSLGDSKYVCYKANFKKYAIHNFWQLQYYHLRLIANNLSTSEYGNIESSAIQA